MLLFTVVLHPSDGVENTDSIPVSIVLRIGGSELSNDGGMKSSNNVVVRRPNKPIQTRGVIVLFRSICMYII